MRFRRLGCGISLLLGWWCDGLSMGHLDIFVHIPFLAPSSGFKEDHVNCCGYWKTPFSILNAQTTADEGDILHH